MTFFAGDGCLCVTSAGFGTGVSGVSVLEEGRGCRDALICERHLTLAFPDKTELWSLEQNEKTLIWSMEIKPEAETTGNASPTVVLPVLWPSPNTTTPVVVREALMVNVTFERGNHDSHKN